MKAYKTRRGFWRHLVIFVLVNVVFFLVIGLIATNANNPNVWGDTTVWLVYGLIVVIAFIYLLFSYLLLPKVLMEIGDESVIIYGAFKRKKEIKYREIQNAGLFASLMPLRMKAQQFVITTKTKGSISVNYLDKPEEVLSTYQEKFNAYIIKFSDQYFSD